MGVSSTISEVVNVQTGSVASSNSGMSSEVLHVNSNEDGPGYDLRDGSNSDVALKKR